MIYARKLFLQIQFEFAWMVHFFSGIKNPFVITGHNMPDNYLNSLQVEELNTYLSTCLQIPQLNKKIFLLIAEIQAFACIKQ